MLGHSEVGQRSGWDVGFSAQPLWPQAGHEPPIISGFSSSALYGEAYGTQPAMGHEEGDTAELARTDANEGVQS